MKQCKIIPIGISLLTETGNGDKSLLISFLVFKKWSLFSFWVCYSKHWFAYLHIDIENLISYSLMLFKRLKLQVSFFSTVDLSEFKRWHNIETYNKQILKTWLIVINKAKI